MKRIILSLLCILLVCGYFYYHAHTRKPFRCDAQIISHLVQDNSHIEINMYANMVVSLQSEAVISLLGTISQDDKKYIVKRSVFFTLQPSEFDGVSKTKIIREEKAKTDDVPDLLWQNSVLLRNPGVGFNSEIKKLHKNAIFLQELSNPLFVCIKTG